ncbi:phosphatidylinositol-specific phospholipase C/glycerophosphodiester phosphodiesterase family protein [Mucilaginibacter boryungensis]|nr:phosphatidylinositol-specific phospholipase C/glycerophosphodiester phosphodiesterase family protein [Mucilaginibacter boryungensis]
MAKYCFRLCKLFFLIFLLATGLQTRAQTISLLNAFAHNDYSHKHPLFDALNNGYNHVEADVYLWHGKLIVTHILPILHHKKELEQLYFQPLEACVNNESAETSAPAYPITLMIDIKSGADGTYRKLEELLDKYKSIISGYENGKFVQRKITVVISGHKPEKLLKAEGTRLAFIDADLMRARQDTLATNVYQMASCKYSKLIKWNGKGQFPEAQRQRLCAYVRMAHQYGEKVRLWKSPDNNSVWKELLSCGVDLINTDKLVKLKNFLLFNNKGDAPSANTAL